MPHITLRVFISAFKDQDFTCEQVRVHACLCINTYI